MPRTLRDAWETTPYSFIRLATATLGCAFVAALVLGAVCCALILFTLPW